MNPTWSMQQLHRDQMMINSCNNFLGTVWLSIKEFISIETWMSEILPWRKETFLVIWKEAKRVFSGCKVIIKACYYLEPRLIWVWDFHVLEVTRVLETEVALWMMLYLLVCYEVWLDKRERRWDLPDIDLSSMLTVFGLLLYLWIQFGLRPAGPGLGLYCPGLLLTGGVGNILEETPGPPTLPYTTPGSRDLTDMAGLAIIWPTGHWGQSSLEKRHW